MTQAEQIIFSSLMVWASVRGGSKPVPDGLVLQPAGHFLGLLLVMSKEALQGLDGIFVAAQVLKFSDQQHLAAVAG
ncbi:MAG: hypothetical protein JZU58_10905 [Curvibacter lanceolatus]|uniref:hypothetical protein n=1 Tax=Curvibacter lanceolatus TaxID=86182 RepID=UPI00146C5604|nr:hypothetical protein [Curvibacter lanceolatus]MBV5292846.1 hypothetical protein [Curvibacter lanceolatus]